MGFEDFLNEEINKAKIFFESGNLFKLIEINDFECEKLNKDCGDPQSNDKCIRDWGKHLCDNFFSKLHALDQSDDKPIADYPCLYMIEIKSEHTAKDIITKIENTVLEGNRTFPAYNKLKEEHENNKILYIGKAQTHVGGRMLSHFGCIEGRHGLHLAYWANEINLKLDFKIFRFEKDMLKYLSAFESILAKQYKPIIGKHSA